MKELFTINFLNLVKLLLRSRTVKTNEKKIDQKMCRKRSSLVNKKEHILLHNTTKPHASKKILRKLSELRCETLPHSAFSLKIDSTYFFFFKHLNHFLNEKIFNNEEYIKTAFEALSLSETRFNINDI
uniref:Uncharacterized protein n=1 Tax=Strongyloides stercoralis TaxID=6248 RepID=A0AAF5DRY8_STRER